MTGWGALVFVCGELALACFVWLAVVVTRMIHDSHPQRVWESAAVLANAAPDLVAEVADAVDPTPLLEHVVSIDTLPHSVLVEKVLEAEAREQDLVEQAQNVQADAIAIVADALAIADAEHIEAVRQAAAKRRHWSTVKRLKGNA